MCAALSEAGITDIVWSCDVIDTLAFGGQAVMTWIHEGGKRQALMCHAEPHKSQLRVVRAEGVRAWLGLQARRNFYLPASWRLHEHLLEIAKGVLAERLANSMRHQLAAASRLNDDAAARSTEQCNTAP
jgi:hypothetical protein